MNWLIYPIIAAFFWAIVNYMDKLLLDKYCKNREIGGLLIFSGLIGAPVAFIVWLLFSSEIQLNINALAVTILAGVLYITALIPYLHALSDEETSSTAPQMLMITAFSALLGFMFLAEKLSSIQLLGLTIIIIGSILLSKKSHERLFSLNRTFILMAIFSILMALYLFLFKFYAIELNFWETTFGVHIGFFLASCLLFLLRNYRKQFLMLVSSNSKGIISINILSEILTITGNLLFHYGSLFAFLAIVGVIAEGIQPLFILLFGYLLTLYFPKLIEEKIDRKTLSRKAYSILLMILGLVLASL